jgi:hypothetical protein
VTTGYQQRQDNITLYCASDLSTLLVQGGWSKLAPRLSSTSAENHPSGC